MIVRVELSMMSSCIRSGSHCWGQEVSTQFIHQFAKTAVTATPLVGCVDWSRTLHIHMFIYPPLGLQINTLLVL